MPLKSKDVKVVNDPIVAGSDPDRLTLPRTILFTIDPAQVIPVHEHTREAGIPFPLHFQPVRVVEAEAPVASASSHIAPSVAGLVGAADGTAEGLVVGAENMNIKG